MDSASSIAKPLSLPLRFKSFAASATLVWLACAVYRFAPYNQRRIDELHGSTAFSFTGGQFLFAAAVGYTLLLGLYFSSEASRGVSKSLRFFRVLATFARSPSAAWRRGLEREDSLAVLASLLKAFYGPMMVMFLMGHCMGAWANGWAIAQSQAFGASFRSIFDQYGFWFLMQVILFVDVLVFTVGYLVELPQLDNGIRSVDPTLLGWSAALLCYPPFNTLSAAILGSPVSDFPRFDDPTAHIALNLALLALLGIYASASVALGFKASNLTHRGIVARGPYALIRHPAYACKNMAWWIGTVPLVSTAFGRSAFDGISALASMAGWSLLYVLRALTEEDHLRGVNGEYAAYAAKVRYRFIPGVL